MEAKWKQIKYAYSYILTTSFASSSHKLQGNTLEVNTNTIKNFISRKLSVILFPPGTPQSHNKCSQLQIGCFIKCKLNVNVNTTPAANPCKRRVISLVRYHLYQHCAWPINRFYISLLVRFRNFPTTAYTR